MSVYLKISPHDPVIARDGRPFGAGSGHRMKSLDWLYPSVAAGSVRTLLGKRSGGFAGDVPNELRKVEVAGPLPEIGGQLYFPRPLDIAVHKDNRQVYALRPRPIRDGSGFDWPCKPLDPAILRDDVQDFKPASLPAFWRADRMTDWLLDRDIAAPPAPPDDERDSRRAVRELLAAGYLNIEKDERMHVKIDPTSGAAAIENNAGMLFMTVGLALSSLTGLSEGEDAGFSLRVDNPGRFHTALDRLDAMHTIGGERRMIHLRAADSPAWNCPDALKAVKDVRHLRLVLATPALFPEKGWLPGWLDDKLEGAPPGSDVKLRLRSVCLDRWKPISGWSYEKGRLGAKAIRRLVPAGSVYFFDVMDGQGYQCIENGWLRSVCDAPQDRLDGFGLALWGIWREEEQ
jgi:CRISPR-associated protein Cmr3